MKKILNASIAGIALLLALSFFLPVFNYTHTGYSDVLVEKYYIYSALISESVFYLNSSIIYILAALAIGVGVLFSNFKSKNILSAALFTVASLLCIFTLIPFGQYIKNAAESDSYHYSLSVGYYIIFILAIVLIVAGLAQIALSAIRDLNSKPATDTETKIKHLIGLKNEGVLTDEEFSILLKRLNPQG